MLGLAVSSGTLLNACRSDTASAVSDASATPRVAILLAPTTPAAASAPVKRYNIMDGMDVYVGDYSKPDPIPAAMLRQLVSAKFLRRFNDEQEQHKRAEAEFQAKTLVAALKIAGTNDYQGLATARTHSIKQ